MLTPNVVSFNVAISACVSKWEGALELLREMVHQLLAPNVVSWSAAMSACEKGKQWEVALGLLQDIMSVEFLAVVRKRRDSEMVANK